MGQEIRIRPFHCGSQALDWFAANCDRCTKGLDDQEPDLPTCPIQHALYRAAIADGMVTAEIGRRMGHDDPTRYVWPCAELEEKEIPS